jgi:hypothetical protein
MIRKATTRGVVLWRCRRSRVWARDEGLGREGVVIVKEIPDQVRNDSKGGIVRFPLRGNGVSINR